jgi:hypothetical protein
MVCDVKRSGIHAAAQSRNAQTGTASKIFHKAQDTLVGASLGTVEGDQAHELQQHAHKIQLLESKQHPGRFQQIATTLTRDAQTIWSQLAEKAKLQCYPCLV